MYLIGIDPGYRNVGFSIIDVTTWVGVLNVVDLATWNGKKHVIKPEHYGELILQLIENFGSVFQRTTHVFIEIQAIGCRNVLRAASYFEQTIRVLYPHVNIVMVDPREVKTFWKTRVKNPSHAKNKKESARLTRNVVSRFHMMRSKSIFTIGGVYHVDAIEAAQMVMFGRSLLPDVPQVITEPIVSCRFRTVLGQPLREFKMMRMVAPINSQISEEE